MLDTRLAKSGGNLEVDRDKGRGNLEMDIHKGSGKYARN